MSVPVTGGLYANGGILQVSAIGGSDVQPGIMSAVVPVGGNSDVTLTPDQYSAEYIKLTGVLTGNINVIVGPLAGGSATILRKFYVNNQTTGAYTVTIKPDAAAGIVLTQGKLKKFGIDGTAIISLGTEVTP